MSQLEIVWQNGHYQGVNSEEVVNAGFSSKCKTYHSRSFAPMKKMQSLEIVRAVAALLVVLFHVEWIFGSRTSVVPFWGIFNAGFRGVDLFFVLSGFIIAHVHSADIGQPKRIVEYAFKRITRIYPALWIMTLVASGAYAIGFGGAGKATKLGMWNVVASFFLLPQENARSGAALINVSWTLKYEVFFYVIFSFLILNKRMGIGLLVAWQLAVLIATLFVSPELFGLGGFYLNSLCLEFSIGLACAWLIKWPVFTNCLEATAARMSLVVVGVSVFIYGMAVEGVAPSAGIACALSAGTIVMGMVLLDERGYIYAPKFLVLLGSASYSIYLVHFSVINTLAIALNHSVVFDKFGSGVLIPNIIFLSAAVVGVAVGVLFHQYIDRPLQILLRKRVKIAPSRDGRQLSPS